MGGGRALRRRRAQLPRAQCLLIEIAAKNCVPGAVQAERCAHAHIAESDHADPHAFPFLQTMGSLADRRAVG